MEIKPQSETNMKALAEMVNSLWDNRIKVLIEPADILLRMECRAEDLRGLCEWLVSETGFTFATMVVEETAREWEIQYIFYSAKEHIFVNVLVRQAVTEMSFPSISSAVHAADWHEREAEDLFGLVFEGHPRLGDFVLHEEWPEGVNPMRKAFNPKGPYPHKEAKAEWQPTTILHEPGAFMMPIGPVYSGSGESAHFLLETVGEDVVRTIPRFFYKYRGVEKIAEGQSVEMVTLLAERFSGSSAFAHSFAFCRAVERASGIEVPERAVSLRTLLAELERLRHHVSAIEGICNSTGLVVAASQAAILEEELLRATCEFTGHRYLFGMNIPGGLSRDLSNEECYNLSVRIKGIMKELHELQEMLRYSSSFLDRLEEVGMVSYRDAVKYGLVGPVARASGVCKDLRKVLPYDAYGKVEFSVPCESGGDGYARLRVLFKEAEQSVNIISQITETLPEGHVLNEVKSYSPGAAIGWVEAPIGAAFHWVRIGSDGRVIRYRITTPSFANWHGFHLAAENFAFQDFPIILASFGLSITESDR